MELDHILIFTQQYDPLADALKNFGLLEGTPNVHVGQGTACRRFFFQNAYLELAWARNEEEIKSAAISKAKLWERSQYKATRHCPFGLCFRTGNLSNDSIALLFDDAWRYSPAFLPEGQFANIASNETFPAEPMLFEMPFSQVAPRDYVLGKQQPLTHQKGFREITKVSLTLPTVADNLSPSMKKVLEHNIVNISAGKDYWVALVFDYNIKEEVQNFYPLAPLTFMW